MNALRQKELILPCGYSLKGFSVSGLATYIQIPEMDCVFDLGECPLSAVGLNHVFLSHAHGDHSRCLMRHFSLRRMMGISHPATYYMPDFLVENFRALVRAEAVFEGVSLERIMYPEIVPVVAGAEAIPLAMRKDLLVQGFRVRHSVPSMGFTIFRTKKKLKPEFWGQSPAQLIAARSAGQVLETQIIDPEVVFIGDCIGTSLWEQDHIWKARTVMIECTFIMDDEKEMARKKGHTHISEIVQVLTELGDRIQSKHIVLKHFSLKYSREMILAEVERQIPDAFKERILLLI